MNQTLIVHVTQDLTLFYTQAKTNGFIRSLKASSRSRKAHDRHLWNLWLPLNEIKSQQPHITADILSVLTHYYNHFEGLCVWLLAFHKVDGIVIDESSFLHGKWKVAMSLRKFWRMDYISTLHQCYGLMHWGCCIHVFVVRLLSSWILIIIDFQPPLPIIHSVVE